MDHQFFLKILLVNCPFFEEIIGFQPRDMRTMMVDKTMQISQNLYEKTIGYFIRDN